MKFKRKPAPPERGAPKWLVTYSDLVTLILVFFILLFSMSQIDVAKFKAIAESFRDRAIFEFYPSAIPLENDGSQIVDQQLENPKSEDKDDKDKKDGGNEGESEEDARLNLLLSEVNKYIEDSELTGIAVATRTERGVVLVLPEQILFNTGEAEILESALPFLKRVSGLLVNIQNIVKVEGHTDNRPIKTSKYPSNWELSSARASSVIRYFIDDHKMDPKRFIASAYSDTRPIVPNTSPENWAKNRRVEIVILDPTYKENSDN